MGTRIRPRSPVRLWLAGAAVLALWGIAAPAQTPSETVGRIAGDDIAVKGEVSLVRAGTRSVATLSSGSEVTVRSGQARITLADGSEIDLCGPAQFSILKSGGAITLALNFGRIHARLAPEVPLTVYTPLVVATPVSIAGRPRDAVVGLESSGAMCALSQSGAVRLEQQLTGASLLVPQGGEVVLPDGHLESLRDAEGTCRCDVVLMEDLPEERARLAQVSSLPPVNESKREPQTEKKNETPARAIEQPTFTAVMPPLTFDASAPNLPPEPPAGIVLLVREVRVRSGVILTGRVEPRSSSGSNAARSPQVTSERQGREKRGGFFGAVKGFFRRLFGGGSKDAD